MFASMVEARSLARDLKPSVLRVLERSGHDTIRVFFDGAVSEERMLELLRSLGPLAVTFERANGSYFALDLEPAAVVAAVRARLDRWLAEGLLEYETCEARVPDGFGGVPDENDDE